METKTGVTMTEKKVFENVKITWKGSKEPKELPRGLYDFYIKDGVIALLCFDSIENKQIVAATIYNPAEIRSIEVF